MSTSSAVSYRFICELQLVCPELCDTSSAAINAGKTKAVTGANCCLHTDDIKVATVCTRLDFSEQLALNVFSGIGEVTVLDSSRDECWAVVFDKFIAAGDEVIMEEVNVNYSRWFRC